MHDLTKAMPMATSMPSQVNSSPVTPGNCSDGNTPTSHFKLLRAQRQPILKKLKHQNLRHSKRKRRHADFKKLLENPSESESEEDQDRAMFFGKRINHMWENKEKKEEWFKGNVTEVLESDETASDCEFTVEYDKFPDPYTVTLIVGFKL